MSFSNVGLISQIIAAILSVVLLRKNKSIFYKLLCIFLVIVVITELIGAYQIRYKIMNSGIIHYISALFQFNLIALMYYELLKDTKWRKFIVLFCVSFLICWFLGIKQNVTYFPYLVTFGCLNSSIIVFLYLRELLMSNKILNYKKHLPFWVSVGFLIFYLPAIPFFSMMTFMNNRDLFFIIHLLIILMNLFIITGLIWSKKEVEY